MIRVIGAGLSRTGTVSLSKALGRLLGEPSYHGGSRPRDIPAWGRAVCGVAPDWSAILNGFGSVVDWPPAAFWPELAAYFPGAKVLLSTRDTDEWWESADAVIFRHVRRIERHAERVRLAASVKGFFSARFVWPLDEDHAKAAYERHNERVRASVPPERLIDWRLGDGWEPLCAGLGVPVPASPFPHENRRTWSSPAS